MINTLFLWTTIIIIALLIEAGAPGLFYFLSLAFGSAAAAFASYFNYDITAQLALCLAVSCLTLVVLRLIIARSNKHPLPTNMHALIGQKVLISEDITPEKAGTAKIYGDIWLVREKNNHAIQAETEVTIVDVQGCHLIVKKN